MITIKTTKIRLDDGKKTARPERFFDTEPFYWARKYASEYGCDLALPNGSGIGNILMFTPLVEALSLKLGRSLKILTGRFNPWVGVVDNECRFPVWKDNPYVSVIVDADRIDPGIMEKVVMEEDNYPQFGHVIENICHCYGLKPRYMRPSLFLSGDEKDWAMETLSGLQRPVVCIGPSGTSSPLPDSGRKE